jgi:hypothetical protein
MTLENFSFLATTLGSGFFGGLEETGRDSDSNFWVIFININVLLQ